MMTATISTHFLSFYRLADNRKWVKASCSCGWTGEGLPAEVYLKAAGHDLDDTDNVDWDKIAEKRLGQS